MRKFTNPILAIVLAGILVSISEFARNELVFKSYWVGHYTSLGLDFPDALINGAVWGVWSLVFAGLVWVLSRRFTFVETLLVAWVAGFVLMWLVVGNLAVLPFELLWFAVPWSVLEVLLTTVIATKVDPPGMRP